MALLSAPAYSRLMGWFYGRALVRDLLALLDPQPGLRLLDVACGAGDLRPLAGPCRYVGLDIEAERVRRVVRREQSNGIIGDGTRLPFSEGSFDIVLAAGFLHHIPDSRAEAALDEMARILRPDGRIVLLDAIWPRRRYNLVGWLGRWLDDGKYVRREQAYLSMFRERFVVDRVSYPTSLGLECILVRLGCKTGPGMQRPSRS
jgi:SAM-dependent methyltransferase